MTKRKISAVLCMLLLAGIFSACSKKADLLDYEVGAVGEMDIQSGNDGSYVTITKREVIMEIYDMIYDGAFEREEADEGQSGWSYRLKFYDWNETQIDEIYVMSADRIRFDGNFWTGKANAIDLALLEAQFNPEEGAESQNGEAEPENEADEDDGADAGAEDEAHGTDETDVNTDAEIDGADEATP